jgi:hypothetical protein
LRKDGGEKTVTKTSVIIALIFIFGVFSSASEADDSFDFEKISYKGIMPGTSTSADVLSILGNPDVQKGRAYVYEKESVVVELVPGKNVVMTVQIILVPNSSVLRVYNLKGNPGLAEELGSLYPLEKMKNYPKAKMTRPPGYTLVWISKSGRSVGFTYEGADNKLTQVNLINY